MIGGKRLRGIALATLLLLTGCLSAVRPTLPVLPGRQASPTPESSATPQPTGTFTPAPSATVYLEPQTSPTPAPTATPAIITRQNAAGLHPVVIYPLFRRGLLHSVQWSPDGGSLVAETSQGLQVLSVDGLHKRYSLPDVTALQFMETNDLLVRTPDGLALLDLAGGGLSPLSAPAGDGEGVFALSPDGAYWATASQGPVVEVQPLAGGEPIQVPLSTKTLIPFSVRRLIFSADSRRLYALIDRTDGENELVAVQVTGGEESAPWTQIYEAYQIDALPLFSPDGERMIIESGERLRVQFTANGQVWADLARRIEKELGPYTRSILTAQAASFLPDDEQIGVLYNGMISDSDSVRDTVTPSMLMIYDTGAPSVARAIDNLPAWVTGFSFSPDGSAFLTTSQDGMLRLWETETGRLLESSEPYDTDATPDVRADGRLAAYSHVESVSLVDPTTGKQVSALGEYPGAVQLDARFAGNDVLAVFVEMPYYRFIDTYDLSNGAFLQRYPDLGPCDFNRDGSLMVCFDAIYKFFDLPSGRALLDVVPQGSGSEFAMSPDGSRVAVCTRGAEVIYIYETRLGSIPKATLGGDPGTCGKLAFSADGLRLASSSGTLWDVISGEALTRFEPTDGGPVAMDTSGDVLVLFPDLVDLVSGARLAQLPSAPDPQALYFQPDGSQLVLRTRRGIEFWTVGGLGVE